MTTHDILNNIHFVILNELTHNLMEPERRRLSRHLEEIVQAQEALTGSVDMLVYAGDVFRNPSKQINTKHRTPLDQSLWQSMDQYLKSQKQCNDDIRIIVVGLGPLYENAQTLQELIDMIPDYLRKYVPTLADYQTKFDNVIQDYIKTPQVKDMYDKAIEKIDFYIAAGLIY